MEAPKPIAEWKTGHSEGERLVALIVITDDGKEVGLTMPPEAALEIAERLADQGRRLLAAYGPLN